MERQVVRTGAEMPASGGSGCGNEPDQSASQQANGVSKAGSVNAVHVPAIITNIMA
jgi:hypothetical protein